MSELEHLSRRLDGLHELQAVVRTMKALSAASIRQYEQAVHALADYYRTVALGLQVVLRDRERPPEPLLKGTETVAAVAFGSDHGLCGRFNEELAAFAVERLQSEFPGAPPCKVLAVGSRLADRLAQAGQQVEADFIVPGSAARITDTVQQILLKLDEWRAEHAVSHVRVFYNRHLSLARYRPTRAELLPVNLRRLQGREEAPWPSRVLPMYDLDRERLFSTLLRQYLFVTLFRACAESLASEHGSRLSAMRSADKSLQERVELLEIEFSQARQGQITGELLDVVAGFEALSPDAARKRAGGPFHSL